MRFGWRGALGIALSVAALWWTLRGIDFDSVVEHIRRSNPLLLALSAAAATGIFPLRARRWRPILHSVAPDLPFAPLWRATAIGMMVSNVVPARAGEVARAYALARETRRVPFTAAFASVAVDRVFDAAVVLLLMFAAMLDSRFSAGAVVAGQPASRIIAGGAIFAGSALAVLYLMARFPDAVVRMYEAVAWRISPRLEHRGGELLRTFVSGLGVLRRPALFAEVLWWTLLHWLLNAFAFWLGFLAVGVEAPLSAALFLQGLIAIGVALPSAPGFFGIFELFAKAGLTIYGVSDDRAVAWAISFHFLSFIPITLIGAWYFARLGLHMREIEAAAPH
ncbi:MAG: flippase-like domain-containing protein [Gemmatimonadota bacterium]|nr:flippase-like domain-containing protein [Gemmatimonadota bacterium]